MRFFIFLPNGKFASDVTCPACDNQIFDQALLTDRLLSVTKRCPVCKSVLPLAMLRKFDTGLDKAIPNLHIPCNINLLQLVDGQSIHKPLYTQCYLDNEYLNKSESCVVFNVNNATYEEKLIKEIFPLENTYDQLIIAFVPESIYNSYGEYIPKNFKHIQKLQLLALENFLTYLKTNNQTDTGKLNFSVYIHVFSLTQDFKTYLFDADSNISSKTIDFFKKYYKERFSNISSHIYVETVL